MMKVGIIYFRNRKHCIFEGENATHVTTYANPVTSAATPKHMCSQVSKAGNEESDKMALNLAVNEGIIIIKTKIV